MAGQNVQMIERINQWNWA